MTSLTKPEIEPEPLITRTLLWHNKLLLYR